MKYTIQGNGDIDLVEQDFLAEGGEGRIYLKNGLVFKIYTDPAKMIAPAKIAELAVLDHPHIVRPLDVVLDAHNRAVGFSMRQVAHGEALARLFTNDFRHRHGIGDDTVAALLEHIMDTIAFIHTRGCLMVDGNEMNYLVDARDWRSAYFIDVDSYQTPGFPATAQMPTIRDYHSQGFSALTDWFAFAVLSCQVWLGIHPYKGKHPKFKKHDLEGRMRANVSIFNPDVSLPAAVRDFNVIPADFLAWLERVLEQGERSPPPRIAAAAPTPVAPKVVLGGGQLLIDLAREFPAAIRWHHAWQGMHTVCAGDKLFVDDKEYPLPASGSVVAFAPKSLAPLCFSAVQGKLHVLDLAAGAEVPVQLAADQLVLAGNTVYCVHRDQFSALQILETGGKMLVSVGTVWKILPHAHLVLDGCVYQNVLGKPYLLLPYRHGNACAILAVPELTGYKVLHGKHDNGVVVLSVYREGRYDLLVLRCSADYTHYSARQVEDLDQPGVNFTVLDNGVALHIHSDGELELFQRRQDGLEVLQDPTLHGDMHLCHDATRVLFYRGRRLYTMRMRQP